MAYITSKYGLCTATFFPKEAIVLLHFTVYKKENKTSYVSCGLVSPTGETGTTCGIVGNNVCENPSIKKKKKL